MKVFTDIIQGSQEWLLLRKAKPSASNFDRIVTAKTGELSKQADDYMLELVAQAFCPDWEQFEGNFWTRRGNELEPEARDKFIEYTGLNAEQVGFCLHDNGIAGCSPDGLIKGDNGNWQMGIEIKCPSPWEHVRYVRDGALPDKYRQQVHGSLAITGLDCWFFWSFFPGMAPLLVEVKPDDYTKKVADALAIFCERYKVVYEELVEKLKPRE